MRDWPYIDPTVRAVGVSRLRFLNATKLRNLSETYLIQDNDEPLAVLLRYDVYQAMQAAIAAERR